MSLLRRKNCATPYLINKHTIYVSDHYAEGDILRNEQKRKVLYFITEVAISFSKGNSIIWTHCIIADSTATINTFYQCDLLCTSCTFRSDFNMISELPRMSWGIKWMELRDQWADSPLSRLYSCSLVFIDLSWQIQSLLVKVEIWPFKPWHA